MRCLLILLLFVVAAASRAHAGLDQAQQAYEDGRYQEALQALSGPALKNDSSALWLLGDMSRTGRGVPMDFVEAYKFYSLAMMASEDFPEEIIKLRTKVASSLSDAEIAEGERRVTARVDERAGHVGKQLQIAHLKKELEICSDDQCLDAALRALRFGPAAADLVPALEANMRRDQTWANRNVYALDFAFIGSAAVPALSRILIDRRENNVEEIYNAQLAAKALRISGPAARSALPSLRDAIVSPHVPVATSEEQGLLEALGGKPGDMIFELKVNASEAIATIGDSQNLVRHALTSYVEREAELRVKMVVGWCIALTYSDLAPALEMISDALESSDERTNQRAVRLLFDLRNAPGIEDAIQDIRPRVEALAQSTRSRELAEAARKALEAIENWPLAQAIELLLDRDFAAAESQSDDVIAKRPTDSIAYFVRGQARRKQGKIDSAVQDYDKIIDLQQFAPFLARLMKHFGAYPQTSSGDEKVDLRGALRSCISDDACFKQLEQGLLPQYINTLLSAGA